VGVVDEPDAADAGVVEVVVEVVVAEGEVGLGESDAWAADGAGVTGPGDEGAEPSTSSQIIHALRAYYTMHKLQKLKRIRVAGEPGRLLKFSENCFKSAVTTWRDEGGFCLAFSLSEKFRNSRATPSGTAGARGSSPRAVIVFRKGE
jgi:hypothetical protein